MCGGGVNLPVHIPTHMSGKAIVLFIAQAVDVVVGGGGTVVQLIYGLGIVDQFHPSPPR